MENILMQDENTDETPAVEENNGNDAVAAPAAEGDDSSDDSADSSDDSAETPAE